MLTSKDTANTETTEDGDILPLDDNSNNENSNEEYSNMLISVKEAIMRSGFAKLDPNIVEQKSDYLVVGYIRKSYKGNKTMPKEFYEIFRNYYPNYHLFCCNTNYFILKSGGDDYNLFIISKENSKLSGFLQKFIFSDENNQRSEIIEISQVPSSTLELTMEYLSHHKGVEPLPLPCPIRSIYMKEVCPDQWDAEWIDKFKKGIVFEIILSANYLDIKPLLHLGSAKIATLIKQMDQTEINRVIEEEEAERRRQNNNDNDDNNDDVTQID